MAALSAWPSTTTKSARRLRLAALLAVEDDDDGLCECAGDLAGLEERERAAKGPSEKDSREGLG